MQRESKERHTVGVWYEVANGSYGGLPCPPQFPSEATCGFGMASATISPTTSTTFVRESRAPSKEVFQVRACSTAGCSLYTPQLVIEHVGILGPVSQPDIPDIVPKEPPPSADGGVLDVEMD